MNKPLPVGKLPPELLAQLLSGAPSSDPRVLVGPTAGFDCAVIDAGGPSLLVFKSDPITFATDEIGWYLVQVNSNDIATTGALPRWLLVTMLLPEGQTTPEMVEKISRQVYKTCREMGISVIGGHTEVTFGLNRPIVIGTLIGEVARDRLVTPDGAAVGDRILLTKGIPIEATAILAREFPERLSGHLSPDELREAQQFLTDPGISVLPDAQIALAAGKVTAMHDPTEGGLAAALWELADAGGRSLVIDVAKVPILPLSARICRVFDLDPMATIASGAMIMTAPVEDAAAIRHALAGQGIASAEIGTVETGPAGVWQNAGAGRTPLPRPVHDEIGRVFESNEG